MDRLLRKATLFVAFTSMVTGCPEDSTAPEDAAPDEAEVSEATPPTLNYIPLNENVCDLHATPDDSNSAFELVVGFVEDEAPLNVVAEEFEICATCEDNALRDLLAQADSIMDVFDPSEVTDNRPAGSYEEYFQKALSFAFRHVVLSLQDRGDGTGRVIVSQGKKQCDDDTDCRYEVQIESLAEDCGRFEIDLEGVFQTAGDTTLVTTIPSPAPFGFRVPLVNELPDDLLGQVDDVLLAYWIRTQPQLKINVMEPTIEIDIDSTGTGVATLSGKVATAALAPVISSAQLVEPVLGDAESFTAKFTWELAPAALIAPFIASDAESDGDTP